MARKIVALLLLVMVVVAAVYAYRHYQMKKELASGETTCVGCMTPEEKARFDKQNAGESQAQDDRPVTRPVAQTIGTAATGSAQGSPAVVSAPAAGMTTQPASPAGLPSTDTVAPNPPNGMLFAGKGAYQWYRQGNLTWRVDTNSGRSCIIYATMEEWHKRIVMSHGCGPDA